MQGWDYKVIEMYNEPKLAMVNWIWEEDGQRQSGKPDVLKKLKELGAEGWELVSTVVYGAPMHYVYWLKRPKA